MNRAKLHEAGSIPVFRLVDLCDEVLDCPHSTPQWLNSGVRVIRNFNLKDGALDFTNGFYVDEKTYRNRIRRGAPEAGDIVISREAPMGVVAFIPDGFKGCLGQRLVLLKVNKAVCDPRYLLFVLMSGYVQTQFRRADVTGSTVSNLTIPDLKEIKIPLIPNQKNVADLLWTIHSTINVNNQINDNLAKAASALYDYWFVQFDFPDEHGRPYKSSGGKMVWNEQLKRQIPEGWQVVKLSSVLKKNTREYVLNTAAPTIDLSVMPSDSISLNILNRSDAFKTNLYVMKQGDLLFGGIRPYLHKAGIAPCDGAVTGTVRSFQVRNPRDYNFALLTLTSHSMFDYAMKVATGTRMPTVSADALLEYAIPYHPEVAQKLNSHEFSKLLVHNVQGSILLTKLRDWLLPMLMNGQATVRSTPPNYRLSAR